MILIMSVWIYHESFEVDRRLLYADIVPVHKLRELRNIMTCMQIRRLHKLL
jgi:hypothetical protein